MVSDQMILPMCILSLVGFLIQSRKFGKANFMKTLKKRIPIEEGNIIRFSILFSLVKHIGIL